MESLIIAFNAIIPFLLYISFGYGVRRSRIVDDVFLKKLNQLVFRAFFPIMMFCNIYQIDKGTVVNGKLVAVGVSSVLLMIACLWIIVPKLVNDNTKSGVIIQASFRSNFVLFSVPLTISIYGESSRAIPTMMIAFIIPLYNVMSVVVLEAFRGGKVRMRVLLKNICTNPMICGVVTGLVFWLIGISLPSCIEKPLTSFSNLCTPLGMFVLGGTLKFDRLRGDFNYIWPTLLLKLFLMPAAVMLAAFRLGLGALERFVLLTMFATPVATGSYPMAQNMGGDGDLAGEFVVVSTVVSVITLFFWIILLGNLGLMFSA